MPIYEFRCLSCGSVSEYLLGSRKEEEVSCKTCGSKNVERLISRPNISVSGHMLARQGGKTCCGREERCEKPPCSEGRCER
jgi:putative FmdB family regulatory protein